VEVDADKAIFLVSRNAKFFCH